MPAEQHCNFCNEWHKLTEQCSDIDLIKKNVKSQVEFYLVKNEQKEIKNKNPYLQFWLGAECYLGRKNHYDFQYCLSEFKIGYEYCQSVVEKIKLELGV